MYLKYNKVTGMCDQSLTPDNTRRNCQWVSSVGASPSTSCAYQPSPYNSHTDLKQCSPWSQIVYEHKKPVTKLKYLLWISHNS